MYHFSPYRRNGMVFDGGLQLRNFVMAAPGLPGAAMMKGASFGAKPVVPVVRKTFPESWLWETSFRLVRHEMNFSKFFVITTLQVLT